MWLLHIDNEHSVSVKDIIHNGLYMAEYQNHTKSKFLLKPNSNKNKTEHVGKYMDNASMQPYTRDQAPGLVFMNHFIHF